MANKVEADIHMYYCKTCEQYPFEIDPIEQTHPWNASTFKFTTHCIERSIYSSRKNKDGQNFSHYPGSKVSGVWECHSDDSITLVAKENLAKAHHTCTRRSSLSKLWSKSEKKSQN